MTNMRWYTAQLEGLPSESRKKLSQKLMRFTRRGGLPSRKQWQSTVQRVMKFTAE